MEIETNTFITFLCLCVGMCIKVFRDYVHLALSDSMSFLTRHAGRNVIPLLAVTFEDHSY
jgi:hypothetical protein